jgi:hypothetical protein
MDEIPQESDKIRHHKKPLIEALRVSIGNVTEACKVVGLHRSTYYEYRDTDPEFKSEIEAIAEESIEKINGVTIGKYDKDGNLVVYDVPPDTTACIFYLKTRGKKRGYVEKTETDITTNGKSVNLSHLSLDELIKLRDGHTTGDQEGTSEA